ncbi:MAG: AMP-binding protein, partial [Anaerovoracaceae bacterium]
KIDRKALNPPDLSDYSRNYTPPETREQEEICQAYGEILGISSVGLDDDFFSLGGDSIKTFVLQNRLEKYGIKKSDIFVAHTPRELAKRIAPTTAVEQSLLDFIGKTQKEEGAYPLTESQLSIYLDCGDPDRATIYNNVFGLFLPVEGNRPDSEKQLKQAVEQVIAQYPILQYHVEEKNGIPSFVHDPSVELPVLVTETEELDREKIAREFIRPFLLEKGPLLRAEIYKNPQGLFLIIDAHHIICDGTSMSILVDNISRAYEGKTLSSEKVSNLDYARYEQEALLAVKESHNDFYRTMLDDLEGDTELYADDDPEIQQLEGKLGVYTKLLFDIRQDLQPRMPEALKGAGVTESTLFFGAYAYLLRLLSGQKKVLVFAGENGRNDAALADTFGMMVHNIPVLVDVDEEISCWDYLKAVQERFFDCVNHDHAAFSELLGEYHIKPEYSFVYQGNMLSGAVMDGRTIPLELYKAEDVMDNLTLHVLKQEGGDYQLRFEYGAGIYTRNTVERFAKLYAQIISGLLGEARLWEIPLVGAEDIAEQEANNATEREYELEDVVTLFRKTVAKYPDNNAVFYQGEMLSYREVDEISDRIAGFLQSKGIGPGKVVSILIPRSTYMVTASLGVLKTGAAYQPLDPSYPSERLTFMMEDASAAYLIADEEFLGKVPEYRGEVLLTERIAGLPVAKQRMEGPKVDDLFILLYTSGSTGMPKGVKILHKNIANFCGWYREFYALDEVSKVAAYASYGFDANMMDLYPALTTGAAIYIIHEEIRLDLLELESYFNENAITHGFMTTQVGRQFYTMAAPKALRFLSTGGEKLVPLKPTNPDLAFYNL